MPTPGEFSTPKRRRWLRPEYLLLIIVALTLIRPGDASWVNDESIMMEMAIRYNATASNIYGVPLPFTPCPFGLQGTRGARYGPLPIWIDQILLSLTHNLIYILAARAFLFSSITAASLYWLTRTLRLSPWFAIVTMLSPWLWIFSRELWDSTICIPISAILFAAYAAFLANKSPRSLCLALLCCILLPSIHLTGIAMVLPVLAHMIFFNRRQLWRSKWSLGTIIILCIYAFWPYLDYFFTQNNAAIPPHRSPLLGWLFPLFGGHYLTLGAAGTIPGDGWQDYAPTILLNFFHFAQWFCYLSLAIVWLGMALAISRAARAFHHRDNASPSEHLCLIALSVWICQTFLDGILRAYFSPQYYAATWVVYLFFAWIAIDWLFRRSEKINLLLRSLLVIYAICLLATIVIIATSIARNAGALGQYYGSSLSNQIQAASEIQKFSDQSDINIQIPQWQDHPLALKVLLELNPPSQSPRPTQHVLVKYRNAYPGDARIEVKPIGDIR